MIIDNQDNQYENIDRVDNIDNDENEEEYTEIPSSDIFHSNIVNKKKSNDTGIDEINLDINVVIGQAKIEMKKILSMTEGAIIELDKTVGEDVDIYVNDTLIAHGEILVVDHNIGIAITEVIK